ncbi:MAG: serine hydrolase [Bacteroidota bacterium]
MRKFLIGSILIFAVAITVAWLRNPQVFMIAWYQRPKVDTYKDFPTREIEPSSRPFSFPVALADQKRIDDFKVRNWQGDLVPFAEYFEKGELLAFVVIRNDTLIFEKYASDFSGVALSHTFSIGKTMVSLMIGKAIELDYIKSTAQQVVEFLPEFNQIPDFDQVTIEDLLNMKSGLQFNRADGSLFDDLFSHEARFYYTGNLKNDLLQSSFDTLPGTRWHYSNLDPLILTWLVEAATGMYAAEFFEKKVWQPLGAESPASFGIDQPNGLENSPSSFQCTALDLAKVGRLLLNNGRIASTQVLSTTWINESLSIGPSNLNNTAKGRYKRTHQYYWWLPTDGEGDYSAEGMRGQRLYVNPKDQIVIVQLAKKGYGGYPYRDISKYVSDLR